MDTINIINNFDQNILMENILIMNQYKLTDLVINVFKDDFKNKSINELTIEYVKEYFNQLKFINWDMFIRLLNLKCVFENNFFGQTNSLDYIIRFSIMNKFTKMIEFLLGLPSNTINWYNRYGINMIYYILSNKLFYSNENIIKMILNNDLINLEFWYKIIKSKTALANFLSFGTEEQILNIIRKFNFEINKSFISNGEETSIIECIIKRNFYNTLESIFENSSELNYDINMRKRIILNACETNNLDIIKLLIKKEFDFSDCFYENKNSLLKIKSEEVLMYLILNCNLVLSNDIFYMAVSNNWVGIIQYYFYSKSIDWNELNYVCVIPILLSNKHFNLTKKVIANSIFTFYYNLNYGLEKYYIDPHGYILGYDDE